mmetsp:Transcript_26392/g.76161  ORF Transcript_26392/g.76161 Transcript_26392/m.76161 type:complete len:214 (+) Transcript_26392:94-735(+)
MSDWKAPMTKLVNQIYSKADAEPFREPVDWKALGLFDYPQIIKKQMDLGSVKSKLENGKYKDIEDAANDVRLVWKNCMTYNQEGSDFYILAENMSKKFEDKFTKIEKDLASSAAAGGGGGKKKSAASGEPTLEEKRLFAKNLYKISKEDLGKVVVELDTKCPSALTKNAVEDEVEINVDLVSPQLFYEVAEFVKNSCGGGGGKKKAAGAKRKA